MADKLFLALMGTNAAHYEQIRKSFDALGLTEGQPKVLYVLLALEGCLQKDLALACHVRASTLTVLLQKLEERGFVQKRPCHAPGGKAARAIYLTAAGKEAAKRIHVAVEELEELSFAGFSHEEREQLFSLLARVEENLRR
ncbi:MAG: MarR family transcriptional regulator [Clostridia bacterium]|nr:MarR family transcriptional regulator [Clostridia bacterium]